MDNAQKAIMIGAGLFITIIVIAAVMLITGIGQDLLNTGTNQLSGISTELNTSAFNTYNGKTYNSGSLAFAAAKNIRSMGGIVKINNTLNATSASTEMTDTTTSKAGSIGTSDNSNFYNAAGYKCVVTETTVEFLRNK